MWLLVRADSLNPADYILITSTAVEEEEEEEEGAVIITTESNPVRLRPPSPFVPPSLTLHLKRRASQLEVELYLQLNYIIIIINYYYH